MSAPSKASAAARAEGLARALDALAGADPGAPTGGEGGRQASEGGATAGTTASHDLPAASAALTEWLEGLVDWNARIDLTAARSDDELVDLMIADAAVLARHVPRGARFVDVGCGAGAPGLALALLRPDLEGTLVEPLDKRVAFLRRTIGALAGRLGGRVTVVRGRGEALAQQGRTFDAAISRATLPPAEWLALGTKLAPRGDVWVLLAQGDAPSAAGWRVADDVRYTWPLTGASRRALRFVPEGDPRSGESAK